MQNILALNYTKEGNGKPIFCLHGFSEDLSTWDDLIKSFKRNNLLNKYALYCIDLTGHGKSPKPKHETEYHIDIIIKNIHDLIVNIRKQENNSFDKYTLLGYSYGGRIASHYALNYADELRAIILESASFGIKDYAKKEQRLNKDLELAQQIDNNNVEFFENYWFTLPIFESQNKLSVSIKNNIKKRRLQNDPHALAHSLRKCGQGSLPYIKNDFLQLCIPTLYISGELDTQYCALANELQNSSIKIHTDIIKDAGHNTHLEQPSLFYSAIFNFLTCLNDDK